MIAARLDALPVEHRRVLQRASIFGKDFWAYGVEPNRPAFDALCRWVHEQGLAPRRVTVEELFLFQFLYSIQQILRECPPTIQGPGKILFDIL